MLLLNLAIFICNSFVCHYFPSGQWGSHRNGLGLILPNIFSVWHIVIWFCTSIFNYIIFLLSPQSHYVPKQTIIISIVSSSIFHQRLHHTHSPANLEAFETCFSFRQSPVNSSKYLSLLMCSLYSLILTPYYLWIIVIFLKLVFLLCLLSSNPFWTFFFFTNAKWVFFMNCLYLITALSKSFNGLLPPGSCVTVSFINQVRCFHLQVKLNLYWSKQRNLEFRTRIQWFKMLRI